MSCSRPRRVARPEELDSDVPPGLGLMLYGYPRIPLRSILGYFPSFPTGTFWSDPKNMKIDWIRTSLRDLDSCCMAIPGFRCAPSSAIFLRSLRELCGL